MAKNKEKPEKKKKDKHDDPSSALSRPGQA